MAYTHSKTEVLMTATAVSATATGDVAKWSPGYMPHIIRAVSVMPTVNDTTLSGMVFNFNHLDLASGSTASAIGVLNGTATVIPGRGMYKDGLNVEVLPGEEVVLNVGTAKTNVNVKAVIYVEPRWETPANQTNLVVTT